LAGSFLQVFSLTAKRAHEPTNSFHLRRKKSSCERFKLNPSPSEDSQDISESNAVILTSILRKEIRNLVGSNVMEVVEPFLSLSQHPLRVG